MKLKINHRKLILWYSIIMAIIIIILLIRSLYTHCYIWVIFNIWVFLSTLIPLLIREKERKKEDKMKRMNKNGFMGLL